MLGRHVKLIYNACMIRIEEYILLSQAERQRHLKLNEPCVYRGGEGWVSVYSKGLLAYILDTSIPRGNKIQLCHACHNGECSNPFHVYWGTPRENRMDAISSGRNNKTVWQYTVAKYGEEASRIRQAHRGNTNGCGNKGKPKPEEQCLKISDSIKLLHKQGVYSKEALVVKSEKASGLDPEDFVGSNPT